MSLDEILDSYYDKIYSFALFRVGSVHDAEDIASEVFVKAAEKLNSYKPEKIAFPTWIFAITLNTIRKYYRKKTRCVSIEKFNRVESQTGAEGKLLLQGEQARLYQTVALLKGSQKEAVLLKYLGGLTDAQVAELLKLSQTNIKTILVRARKSLSVLKVASSSLNIRSDEKARKAVYKRMYTRCEEIFYTKVSYSFKNNV
jgi:RNA polymerase sigma-70 factor (ECF subfamily)